MKYFIFYTMVVTIALNAMPTTWFKFKWGILEASDKCIFQPASDNQLKIQFSKSYILVNFKSIFFRDNISPPKTTEKEFPFISLTAKLAVEFLLILFCLCTFSRNNSEVYLTVLWFVLLFTFTLDFF